MTIDPEGEFMKGMIERTLKEAEKKIVPTYFRESSLKLKLNNVIIRQMTEMFQTNFFVIEKELLKI